MNRRSLLATLALALTAPLVAHTQTPLGTAFTYQGKLDSSGAGLNGVVDFRFRLFDAAVAGNELGAVNVDDVPITDGLFTVALDFGQAPFTGSARWLEIGVRETGVNFTTLTPRQLLTPAPFALYALNDANWTRTSNILTNGPGTNFVGINRSTRVTPAEYFGVQAPVSTNGGYGGMYVRTDGATARPFYGYALGTGGVTTWTYLDGPTGDFRIYHGGDRISIAGDGRVGIGTTSLVGNSKLQVSGGVRLTTGPLIVDGTSASIYDNDEAGNLLSVHNDGTGNAGRFIARQGFAVRAEIFAGSSGNAVDAYTGGTGRAGRFEVDNANNSASGLFAVHNGTGNAFAAVHQGTGRAGYFQIDNPDSSAIALYALTNGDGAAGRFQISNTASPAAAISASTNGVGYAASFSHSGTGSGVSITMANASNPNPALIITQLNHSVPALNVGGIARVEVLEVTGADVAEKFPVSDQPAPGAVVEIDPDTPGKLRTARGAYNRRVAGVVSGAGDLKAGTVLGHMPGSEDAPPIALSGRVWVQCDATAGPITIGDLLTTADAPGYAMAATDMDRAQGAILGKAMTALPRGERGLVLVLVNLQ
jgi:hypothetical protein